MIRAYLGKTYVMKQHIVQCRHCKDILESKEDHDFQECSCRKIAIDGGIEKGARRLGRRSDVLDLSVWVSKENPHDILPQEVVQKIF